MTSPLRLIAVFFCMASGPAVADVLDYHNWEQLNQISIDESKLNRLNVLPTNISPGVTQQGLTQDVLNYNLEKLKKETSLGRMLDTTWGSHKKSDAEAPVAKAVAPPEPPPPPGTTFQFKPFETKAIVDFSQKAKATLQYQVLNNSKELLVTPDSKYHGITLGYSFLVTSADARSRLSLRYEW